MVEGQKSSNRVVVVGDGAVGKTSLIHSYGGNEFTDKYVPTVAANYDGICEFDDEEVNLHIWDTCGQDEFKNVRPMAYNKADCFVICFNLADRETLDNAVKKWRQEVTTLGPPNAAKILVGTKSDMRDEMKQNGESN